MSLFNHFKKVDKSAISSAAINVNLTANEKKSVSDLIKNAEKEAGKHIVMYPKISLS